MMAGGQEYTSEGGRWREPEGNDSHSDSLSFSESRRKTAKYYLPAALCLAVGLSGAVAATSYDHAASDQSQEPGYGKLAQSTYRIFEEMVAGLRGFDETTLPHETPALRRTIGDVWSHLDIFAYAYPTGEGDLLPALLATFKHGYDRMGDFKDLFDRQVSGAVQYDGLEIKSVRDPVLAWRREILEPARIQTYRRYFRNPSNETVFMRPKATLSRCYWGGVREVPSAERSGYQNLRVLMVALVEKLQREYVEARNIKELINAGTQQVFHGFRVHVRCVLAMIRYFPQLTADIPGARVVEDRLEALVAKYGDLNDVIMAFNVANSKKQKSRSRKLRRTISTKWSELRKWQSRTRIDQQLQEYYNLLKLPLQRRSDR